MKIPFSPPDITEAEIEQVAEALRSGWITTGPKTKELEREVADLCGTNRAVCLNSQTACAEMTLRLLGIHEGDEVITCAYTYTASASVVCHVGAKLVLIDTQEDSLEMDYNKLAEAITERDSLPSMKTLGVTTLISDSGITRYKIITEEWEIYDKKNPPYWAFEKGVYLEKFDSLFHIDASIKADTAYYYEKKKLWELRSNVHIRSQRGDKFDTDLLFWDEKQERVYSDKFIRIEQEDKIITGYGFESNQQMTEYQIYNNTGIFTVEDTAPADSTKAVANSTRTDSIR